MSESTSQSPDVATLLASMMSSPESLSKIGEIISKHTNREEWDSAPQVMGESTTSVGNDGEFNRSSTTFEDNRPTDQNSKNESQGDNPLNFLSFFASEKFTSLALKDEQIALLLAMRPYLSKHRRELIDGFIKLQKIAGIFKNLSQEKH